MFSIEYICRGMLWNKHSHSQAFSPLTQKKFNGLRDYNIWVTEVGKSQSWNMKYRFFQHVKMLDSISWPYWIGGHKGIISWRWCVETAWSPGIAIPGEIACSTWCYPESERSHYGDGILVIELGNNSKIYWGPGLAHVIHHADLHLGEIF